MTYPQEQYLADIRTALDLGADDAPLLAADTDDASELRQICLRTMPQGARMALQLAPLDTLSPCDAYQPVASPVLWEDSALPQGAIALPQSFLRLLELRMSDWHVSLHTLLAADHPAVAMQRRDIPKGLRATPDSPLAVLLPSSYRPRIRFWGCADTKARCRTFLYVSEPALDAEGAIALPTLLYRPAILLAAAFTAQSLGDNTRPQSLMPQAYALMGINSQTTPQ